MARSDPRVAPTPEQAAAVDVLVEALRSPRGGGVVGLLVARLDPRELEALAVLLAKLK